MSKTAADIDWRFLRLILSLSQILLLVQARWQQSKSLSSSALLVNELRVLDDIAEGSCFLADVQQNNPHFEQDITKRLGRNPRTVEHVFIANPDLLSSCLHVSTLATTEGSQERQRDSRKFDR